jgi:type II secretory pathway component GspD/PulD (secretin)
MNKKKVFAGLMLAAFVLTNVKALATQEFRPALRELPKETALPLRGEVSITTKNSPVTLSLRESDVTQVLRMFADKAGLNIILHPQVQGQTVTLDLVKVPLNKAFEMVMEITSLTYVLDGNTIIIAPTSVKNFNVAKQDMTSIPVKYVDAATIAEFLNKNIYGIDKPGISGGEIAVTNPSTNELLIFGGKNEVAMAKKVVEKFDKQPVNTVFKVNHTTPAQMADMVCNMLLPNALGTKSGGGGGGSSGGGDGLSLNQGTIACTYDTKANAGALTSIGLQSMAVSYYTGQGTLSVLGGSPQQIEMIRDFIAQTDKKQPQAYLEVSIIEVTESGSKTLNNTWEIQTKYFSAGFSNGDTGVTDLFKNNNRYPDYPHLFSSNPSLKYTIQYLVENSKARVVANPRILITNGQESVIDLTSDYVKTVTSQVVGGSFTPSVQRTYEIGDDQGIQVSITPFISPDGYVTLDIAPEYAVEAGKVTTPNADDPKVTDIQATLLSRRNLDLKSVRIKDGETLVIGGMINEKESKTVKKVPLLGDLPILGSMFRSTTTEKKKEEMIIMITPKIINDTEDKVRETL